MVNEYLRVGPRSTGLGLRILASDGPSKLVADGLRAEARLLLAREMAGVRHDKLIKETIYLMDRAATRPWPAGGAELLKLLRPAGLDIAFDEAAARVLEERMAVVQARLSRWLPITNEAGDVTEWEYDPGTVDEAAKAEVRAALTELGWSNPEHLFPFSFDDVTEVGTKQDILVATPMGTGKSRFALALTDYYRHVDGGDAPTIIFGLKRHLLPWEEELGGVAGVRPCRLLTDRYGAGCYEKWTEKHHAPTFNQPYLLVSLERLRLMDDEQLARLKKVAARSRLVVDEGYVAANRDAKLTKRLWEITGKHHIMLSGTPIRGLVNRLLPLIQWVHRGGSVALPDYPMHIEGSQKRWDAKHLTYATSGGSRKATAFIRNQEELNDLLAPLMKRRLRNEPEIVRVLGEARVEPERRLVELDPQHTENYRAVLEQFIEWYKRERIKKEKKGGLTTNEILVKLGYLVWNVPAPWRMEDHSDEEFFFPAYDRQPTAIHREAIKLAVDEVAEGNVCIIAGISTLALDLMHEEALAAGLRSAVIHGGVNEDKRREILAAGRAGELDVVIASVKVIAEGLNMSWASRMIVTEYTWDSATLDQLLGRITRGVQSSTPKAYFLIAKGTIQEYMIRIATMKKQGASAALDRTEQYEDQDIPDIQQYANSLVNVDGEAQVEPRDYRIELN